MSLNKEKKRESGTLFHQLKLYKHAQFLQVHENISLRMFNVSIIVYQGARYSIYGSSPPFFPAPHSTAGSEHRYPQSQSSTNYYTTLPCQLL